MKRNSVNRFSRFFNHIKKNMLLIDCTSFETQTNGLMEQ